MITRNTPYASKPHAARIRSTAKPTGLAAPQGFSRPTFSSTARSSSPRAPRPEAPQEIPPPPPKHAPLDDHLDNAQHSPTHSQTPPASYDARLDRDLVLAPYWFALREKGFESSAVLQSLSRDQAMKALEMCGVDKIGHRWYILNKYCTPPSHTAAPPMAVDSSHVANNLAPSLTYTPKSRNNFVDVASFTQRIEPLGAALDHAVAAYQHEQDEQDPSVINSPMTSSLTLDSPAQPSPEGGRGVLHRRLQRPKFATRHRASVSPLRRRNSPVGGISKELLHPPEHHEAQHEVINRPPVAALPVEAPTTPTPYEPLQQWGIASPPVGSLHESATYKTLVSLLGTPSIPMLGSTLVSDPPRRNQAASQRRRSASPPSSDALSSAWALEAARRRFLAPTYALDATPPVHAAEAPLSPFVFSRPL
jgi:hypothetical protein